MCFKSWRVKLGLGGLSGVSSVFLVVRVVGGVLKLDGEGGRSLTLMSLPCVVLIVPSRMRPSANGQPVFRRGLGFHITVTMWFGFPHHGNNGNVVVRVLVLLCPFVAVVGNSAQPGD